MSNVIAICASNCTFFASDTASTISIGGQRYRYSDDVDKILVVDRNKIIALTGDNEVCSEIKRQFLQNHDKTPETMQEIARRICRKHPDKFPEKDTDETGETLFLGSIIIGMLQDGKSILYSMESHDDFQITEYCQKPGGQIICISSGYKTAEAFGKISELIRAKDLTDMQLIGVLQETYNWLSSQEIGGFLNVYLLASGQNKLVYRNFIKEAAGVKRYPQDYAQIHHLNASKLTAGTIGANLAMAATLSIQDGETIKAGMTAVGTGDNNVRIWAGDTFANRATAPFRVTQAGALVATNATITGSIRANEFLNIDGVSILTTDKKLIKGDKIEANTVVAGSVKAENIDTTTAKIGTVQIEDLVVGGNVEMGPDATIDWGQVSNQPVIPTLPGYIQSTKITGTSIESCTITGNTIQTAVANHDRIVIANTGFKSYNNLNELNGWVLDSGNFSELCGYYRNELRASIVVGGGALFIQPENSSTLVLGKSDGSTPTIYIRGVNIVVEGHLDCTNATTSGIHAQFA